MIILPSHSPPLHSLSQTTSFQFVELTQREKKGDLTTVGTHFMNFQLVCGHDKLDGERGGVSDGKEEMSLVRQEEEMMNHFFIQM